MTQAGGLSGGVWHCYVDGDVSGNNGHQDASYRQRLPKASAQLVRPMRMGLYTVQRIVVYCQFSAYRGGAILPKTSAYRQRFVRFVLLGLFSRPSYHHSDRPHTLSDINILQHSSNVTDLRRFVRDVGLAAADTYQIQSRILPFQFCQVQLFALVGPYGSGEHGHPVRVRLLSVPHPKFVNIRVTTWILI